MVPGVLQAARESAVKLDARTNIFLDCTGFAFLSADGTILGIA
jgi:hypothetical protein